jgi:hypothetical protein
LWLERTYVQFSTLKLIGRFALKISSFVSHTALSDLG